MPTPLIRTEIDADGVMLATIDMPGRAMNVFSSELMDALESLMNLVDGDPRIKAVVLTSGKPAFLAGADLEMIRMFTERARDGETAELHALFGRLGRLFLRLEKSATPYVAAINGLALGGGLELALACRARVVVDDDAAQLGLPEIKLGLLPGAGGTQRLPRLIGPEKGLQMLLTGEPVLPRDALALGLVDAICDAAQLIPTARMMARSVSPQAPWHRDDYVPPSARDSFSERAIASALRISDEQLRHYPAFRAIIDCVAGGWSLPFHEACDREMRIFVELMRDPVAGNMVRTLFLNRQQAQKRGLLKPDGPYASGEEALLPTLRRVKARAEQLQLGEEQRLLAFSLAALRCWQAGKAEQPAFADVAAVVADLVPSYTGGPFTYLQQLGSARVRAAARVASSLDSELFAVPSGLDDFFARPS